MALKQATYRGKTVDELKQMSFAEFAKIVPARERRSITRGLSHEQKCLLRRLDKNQRVRTHSREMIIFPQMIDKTIEVHDGRNFIKVIVTIEMIGHRLGEFVLTRRTVRHSAPGIGATKSSAAMSVK